VCAYFDMGQPGTTAFRADMDALPVREETGLEYSSTHLGKMHACGHDCHTAVLLGLAERLARNKMRLPSNILLIFQPAEETTCGALGVAESGIFEKYNVKRIFGLHVFPGDEPGRIRTIPGAMMPGAVKYELTVRGRGCHLTQYKQGIDPIWGAARLLSHLYPKAEEREDLIFRLPMLNAGTAPNVIPEFAVLSGSARCFSEEAVEHVRAAIRESAAKMKEETGCELEIREIRGADPVCNDEELVRIITSDPELNVGLLPGTVSGSEDFSVYQRYCPGVFFSLGVGDTEPLHSPRFCPDDSCLSAGTDFFWKLAVKF